MAMTPGATSLVMFTLACLSYVTVWLALQGARPPIHQQGLSDVSPQRAKARHDLLRLRRLEGAKCSTLKVRMCAMMRNHGCLHRTPGGEMALHRRGVGRVRWPSFPLRIGARLAQRLGFDLRRQVRP
jgi:hypothetical protein